MEFKEVEIRQSLVNGEVLELSVNENDIVLLSFNKKKFKFNLMLNGEILSSSRNFKSIINKLKTI